MIANYGAREVSRYLPIEQPMFSSSERPRKSHYGIPAGLKVATTGTVFNKLWKMNFPVEVGTTTTSPLRKGGSGASPDLIESMLYSKPLRRPSWVRKTITSEEA
jgi:hypothetical protein